jgi:hypothetical protein
MEYNHIYVPNEDNDGFPNISVQYTNNMLLEKARQKYIVLPIRKQLVGHKLENLRKSYDTLHELHSSALRNSCTNDPIKSKEINDLMRERTKEMDKIQFKIWNYETLMKGIMSDYDLTEQEAKEVIDDSDVFDKL